MGSDLRPDTRFGGEVNDDGPDHLTGAVLPLEQKRPG